MTGHYWMSCVALARPAAYALEVQVLSDEVRTTRGHLEVEHARARQELERERGEHSAQLEREREATKRWMEELDQARTVWRQLEMPVATTRFAG